MIPNFTKIVGTLIRQAVTQDEIITAFEGRNHITVTHNDGSIIEIFDASFILSEPRKEDVELLVFFKPSPNPYRTGLIVRLSDCNDVTYRRTASSSGH